MAEEDAFLVHYVEGGLCIDNTDVGIVGRCNSGSNKNKGKVYTNVESANELWDSLESKYMAKDSLSKKFLVSNFNNYKIVDSRPVMDLYNKLLRILGQYTQHGLKMDESISVSSIIDKLPPSWKDFKHTLKHGKDDLSLVQLGSHLRIEESLRAQESDKGKGKEVGGLSVNMTEEGGKNKITYKIKVDAIAWWIDSDATTHVCKDRCWFKTFEPVKDGSVLYMGDVYLLHAKYEAHDKFRIYKTEVELQQNDLIKTLRTDRGGEYYDLVFFQSVGIIHETTAPYIPQQNDMAERKNRALKETVNSMLSYSGLSEGF
nr:zinc finger, CCHC-type [Tanacetum cinerariifolium]